MASTPKKPHRGKQSRVLHHAYRDKYTSACRDLAELRERLKAYQMSVIPLCLEHGLSRKPLMSFEVVPTTECYDCIHLALYGKLRKAGRWAGGLEVTAKGKTGRRRA